jgi:hypothetical protein
MEIDAKPDIGSDDSMEVLIDHGTSPPCSGELKL